MKLSQSFCLRASSALLLAFAMQAFAMQSIAAETPGYAEARQSADRDEASLDAARSATLIASQRVLLEGASKACTAQRDQQPFVIITKVDASGRVVDTWRHGESAQAVCFAEFVAGRPLASPPRAPFFSSMEISF